jgi:hypothetical protein
LVHRGPQWFEPPVVSPVCAPDGQAGDRRIADPGHEGQGADGDSGQLDEVAGPDHPGGGLGHRLQDGQQ